MNRNNFQRSGSCKQCGNCCRNLQLLHKEKVIASEEEWFRIQDQYPIYKIFEIISKSPKGLTFQCTKITKDNLCSIYTQRPPVCRRYPKRKQLIMHPEEFKNCGFYLSKRKSFAEELNEFTKKK
jgi:Fe-S-cluster containining protein